MLQQAFQNAPGIHITPVSSVDESLLQIERYIKDRLIEENHPELAFAGAPILLDFGILGVSHKDYNTATSWPGDVVYPIRLYRSLIILGPLCRPAHGGPCPQCLERRWLAVRTSDEQKALTASQQALVYGHNPRITPFALEAIWSIILSALRQEPAISQESIGVSWLHALDLYTFQVSRHRLIPDSLCPTCARPVPDTAENAQIRLLPRAKRSISDYRLVKAAEYAIPVEGLVNPICGALGGMAAYDYQSTVTTPVTGVFKVRTKFALHNAYWSGHGNSYTQSKRLGMLEGLERYAGQIPRAKDISIYDSYDNLAPDALDPTECGTYHADFYRRHYPVYLPFTRDRQMHWIWAYSFKKARPILVPEQIAYYLDYRMDHANFVQECSNGCATGSCLEEAILFGLLELIERDAFLIAWYARLGLPGIDAASCHDPEILAMVERVDRMGYDLYLFDMRLDIRVPSVMGVGMKREPGLGQLMFAAGSGLHPEEAIRGALCEVASYIPNFDKRVADRQQELREMVHDYSKVVELPHHGLLFGLPEMAPHANFLFQQPARNTINELYGDWLQQRPQTYDLTVDLRYCIDEILRLGLDVIVVDQTCPEQDAIGLKTVCVIVPGLLPMDFGWERQRAFGLPRLRTVPRTSGFLDSDFDPAHNQLVPHPFP